MNPKASPLTYLGIIIIFIMPFLEFSCQGHKIASLSGYQVAFGTELAMKSPVTGKAEKQKVDATPMVAIAFFLTLAAAGVALVNCKAGLAPAGLAALFLLLARSGIEKNTMEEGQGMIAVNFQSGYYFSLLVIVVGGVLGIITTTKKKKPIEEIRTPIPPEMPSTTMGQVAVSGRPEAKVTEIPKKQLSDAEISLSIAQASIRFLGIKEDQMDSRFSDLRLSSYDIDNLLDSIEERFGFYIAPINRDGILCASDIVNCALKSKR